MRSALVGLTLLASAAAIAAEKPIPQDAARIEARSRERLDWNRRTLRGAYDKVGKKDPRWDGPAREALDLTARMFSQQVDPVVSLPDIHAPAKKAVAAGCDDPLILYLYARSSVGPNFPQMEEYTRRVRAASKAMVASAYSPFRRASALNAVNELEAAKADLGPEDRRDLERGLDAVLDLLPRSAAEDPRDGDWEDRWYDLINSVIRGHRRLGTEVKAAFDRVDDRLAKVPGIEALRLTIKGNFLLHRGWEARTEAVAAAVTEDQFRTFEKRLRDARAALEEAWKTRPGQSHVADLMLAIGKGIGGGDRAAMETWFERAMTADPNDREACWQKLDWLDPKWYGDPAGEQMLAFGKACRATKNWRAGITLLVADAHFRHYDRLPQAEKAAYMRSPEVWADIQSVYDEYLEHFPADAVERSKYALFCYLGARFPEAHAQFQALGDRLTAWSTYPNASLEFLQKARDYTAKVMEKSRQQPGGGPPR